MCAEFFVVVQLEKSSLLALSRELPHGFFHIFAVRAESLEAELYPLTALAMVSL